MRAVVVGRERSMCECGLLGRSGRKEKCVCVCEGTGGEATCEREMVDVGKGGNE